MKKVKFFTSLLRERDWLEEMATQGWLLQNMTLGIIYDFKAIEPCEKVYEIERFAISSNPTVSELTARSNVINMAKEFGWEVATHDEMLNYYFVKDKAGDETDEFYSNEEDRRARIEHFSSNHTSGFWKADLILAILNTILLIFVALFCYFYHKLTLGLALACMILGIYFINSVFTNLYYLSSLKQGKRLIKELCMSRTEWEAYKKLSDEASFSTLPKLRTYLEEKSKAGLILTGYESGTFHFENAEQQFDYVFDTKSDLMRRLKKEGTPFTEENKDWLGASLKWYETSIAQAAKYNLKPIAVLNQNILVYKRPHSEEPLPWESKHKRVIGPLPRKSIMIILFIFFLLCLIFGFNLGREFGRMLKDTLPNL